MRIEEKLYTRRSSLMLVFKLKFVQEIVEGYIFKYVRPLKRWEEKSEDFFYN